MNTDKEILKFCNDVLFYDHNVGIICDLNRVREFILNRFQGTVPQSRILLILSIIDDIFLKVCNEVYILNDINNLRQNIVRMFSDEKSIKDEKENLNEED